VGRIVVIADDWPISDRYWSTSASTFTLNTFSWLTEFSSGKRILRDAYSDQPIKNNVIDTLQTNGYTVTIMDTTSWTPALLATYDAVLIEYCSINHTLLTEYVMGGGGVFLIGGHSGSDLLYNEFLLNFGMSLQEPIYPVMNPKQDTLTNFVSHPVTTGVSALEMVNPTPIEVYSSDSQILATFGDWNCLVVCSKVEAPSIIMVSPNGGEVWQDIQTITWTATDPQDDPLTYTVYYSPNGGQIWTQLAMGLTEPSYLWDTTTVVDGTNYRIKVEASDGMNMVGDLSNAPFKIANGPIVTVVSPNGGEQWYDKQTITWTATDPQDDPLTYTVYYSPDDGQTWTQLAMGLTEPSYLWDTTTVGDGTNYLIQVEASDGTFTSMDISNAPFEIANEPAATGNVQWSRTYGGAGYEGAFEVIPTADSGYILVGFTTSYGVGANDFWLVKTDAHGEVEWQQTFGGVEDEAAFGVIETADSGFTLVGGTASYGAGETDAWLVKTDASGIHQWNQTYGSTGNERAYAVIQAVDGGFILAGYTKPYGAAPELGEDFWLVKTDTHGNMEWQQTYDRGFNDVAFCVIQTTDGGFALTGRTASYAGGGIDAWLVKTDAHGNMEWQQTFGGDSGEGVKSVIQTTDGGFALAGRTFSYGAGEDDFWLVKTDASGNMEWQQTYGGPWKDGAPAYGKMGFIETTDGGYALVGCTNTSGANGPYGPNYEEAWLVKTNARGEMQWAQAFGGSKDDQAYSIIETPDGAFVFAGTTASYGSGGSDAWLVKIIPPETMPFELSEPTVTVEIPNGSEIWQGIQTIIWSATDPQADPLTYTVYYSPNGGQTWTQLATGLIEPSYLWDTTTVVDGANYLIKVEATDGTSTGMDLSDAPFEIANETPNTAPTVLVIRPNGGERVRGIFEIQWQAIDPDGDKLTFTISYSPNGGDTWTQLTSEVTGSSYPWDTSGEQVGENYLIKIEANDGILTAEDCSDAPFTVEREILTETRSKELFVPSFRVLEVLGALFVLLGLGKRQKRRKMLLEGQ